MPIELVIALVLIIAMLCQWFAWRVKLPAILFLLISGLIVGPVMSWVKPDELFGDLLMPMVSLSVAIILFEGSLTLAFKEIKGVGAVVQRMITVGALTTWVIVACATHYIFDFSWQISTLFGAVVIVTGPTVIVPMLRSVKPNQKIANILRWEGITIDPIGALMAVMTYEFILVSVEHAAISYVIWLFLQTVTVGLLIGIAAEFILGTLLAKRLIPDYLQNLATLSMVLLAFTLSNELRHESGLIAVTVMGMWLANTPSVKIHAILNFKEHLSLLLISILFILLAARIDLTQLVSLFWPAMALLFVLQFIARPIKVLISTIGLDVSWKERGLLAWIAPRGIVAAAISALFAEKLVAAGFTEANLLVPLTFFMIIGTVVVQSSTSRFLAKWLGVAEPPARGFLIIGANAFSRAVAKELAKYDFRCLLADSNWDNIRQARMDGLETYYGNAVSEHADIHLDLSGIGSLLAMSRQRYTNTMAAVHFRADFAEERIYSLASPFDNKKLDKHKVSGSYHGNTLFGSEVSYSELVNKVVRGSQIKSTTLTDEFTWSMYQAKYRDSRLFMFMIDKKGYIQAFTANNELRPAVGSTIISLQDATEKKPEQDANTESNLLVV